MALAVFLYAVCVLFSSETQGSVAVTPVFVKQGDDVLLEVNEHVELKEQTDYFVWTFNQASFVVKLSYDNKKKIYNPGRVEFSVKNHSLLLKNLQHADSGNYAAQVIGETDRIITEYKVTVQNPVSPVQLLVNPPSISTESCILTVSCSTERSNISSTFRCDDQTCYQKGGEQSKVTTSGSSLHVYLLNDSIICNHSNQVSWKKDMKGIQTLCSLNPGTNGRLTIVSWIGIIVGCLVIIFCICFGLFKGITRCNQQKRKVNSGNTVYDIPQGINPAQRPNQNATEDASGCTTYSSVEISNISMRSTKTKNTTLPETIYCQVSKPQ